MFSLAIFDSNWVNTLVIYVYALADLEGAGAVSPCRNIKSFSQNATILKDSDKILIDHHVKKFIETYLSNKQIIFQNIIAEKYCKI